MTPVRNTHAGCAVSTVAGHCHFVRTQGQARFAVVVAKSIIRRSIAGCSSDVISESELSSQETLRDRREVQLIKEGRREPIVWKVQQRALTMLT